VTEPEKPKQPDAGDDNPKAADLVTPLPDRRVFLAKIAGLVAACVAVLYAIPFVRYLLYPVSVRGGVNPWTSLGPTDALGSLASPRSRLITVTQRDGWMETDSKKAVYITKNTDGQVEVLSAVCPHLGCTVQWNVAKHEFLCPCHGSVFTASGARVSGPTPRGMDSLPIKVENGNLMVRYAEFRQLTPVKEVLD
jgi:menaquinol-cytochrome c reductase iron-sulfur subunit